MVNNREEIIRLGGETTRQQGEEVVSLDGVNSDTR